MFDYLIFMQRIKAQQAEEDARYAKAVKEYPEIGATMAILFDSFVCVASDFSLSLLLYGGRARVYMTVFPVSVVYKTL